MQLKNIIIFIVFVCCISSVFSDWYDTSWLYAKNFTINIGNVTNNQTNFPVLISITDRNLSSFAQSTGNDILFTKSDGTTKLSHEIESYNSTSGQLIAWVKMNLSNTTNNVIWMYYGNSVASNQQDKSNVWTSNYRLVMHLSENANNVSQNYKDSTSYGTNGTGFNMLSRNSINTKIGKGYDARDNDWNTYPSRYINVTGSSALNYNPPVTLSAWLYWLPEFEIDNADLWAFGKLTTESDINWQLRGLGFKDYDALWYNRGGGDETVIGTNNYPSANWYHVVVMINSSTDMRFYINGVLDATFYNIGTSNGGTAPFTIGKGVNDENWNGSIDEVRLLNNTVSSGWIATEYRNQNNPSSFYTVGTQQTIPCIVYTNTTYTNQNLVCDIFTIANSNINVIFNNSTLKQNATLIPNNSAIIFNSGSAYI